MQEQINTNNIFFCSDHHFCHNRKFIYQERGYSSIEEMNEDIISKHNSIVNPNDVVYFLGDIGLGVNIDKIIEYIKRLNGQKYLIIGNHDTDNKIKQFVKAKIFNDIVFGYRVKIKKKIGTLTHYPMITSNFQEDIKVWSIHGHTHSKEKFSSQYPWCYNVCLDAHNMYPVSIEELFEDIKEAKI